jgi:hypothetical protein
MPKSISVSVGASEPIGTVSAATIGSSAACRRALAFRFRPFSPVSPVHRRAL